MKGAKILPGLALAIFFFYRFVLWWVHPLRTWADQSVYLAMSQLLLMGNVPYKDFFDFNPPLIIYLNTFPWLVAGACNWPITFAFIISIYILTALSLWLTWLVFNGNKEKSEYKFRWFVLFALLAFTQAQQSDFGQREHLFILLFFPYVILRCFAFDSGGSAGGSSYYSTNGSSSSSRGGVSRPAALIIGVLAGIGVCIKPHFLEVLIAFELAWQLSRRQLKLLLNWECIGMMAAIVLYMAHFLLLPKAALDVLFNQALPIYTGGVASFASSIICGLTLDSAFYLPIYSMVLLLAVSTVLIKRSTWIVPIAALVLISFVIYLQSGTVWTYRMLPLQAFLDLLAALEIGIVCDLLMQRLPGQKLPAIIRTAAPYGLLISCCLYGYCEVRAYIDDIKGLNKFSLSALGYNGTNPANDLDAVFFTILKHTFKDDRVVLIGPAVLPGYPAILQAGRLPGSRYLHGMILPMLHYCRQIYPGKKYDDLEKSVVQNYGQDILKNKPKLVLISEEFIRPQLDSYEFVPTYLKDYEVLGNLHQVKYAVYKLKDKQLLGGLWPVEKRRQLILKILSESLTAKQAAEETGLSQSQIEDWAKRAEESLSAALTDNPGGGESELRSMVLESIEKTNKANAEIAALKKELQELKAKGKSR